MFTHSVYCVVLEVVAVLFRVIDAGFNVKRLCYHHPGMQWDIRQIPWGRHVLQGAL